VQPFYGEGRGEVGDEEVGGGEFTIQVGWIRDLLAMVR
jgi:hypothetical protein